MKTQKTSRIVSLGLALCVALVAGRPAQAAFQFNPTGGGSTGALAINGFQPSVNSGFANGGLTAVRAVTAAGGTGTDTAANQFVFTYQTNFTGLLPNNVVDPGLNVSHQLTATVQMREYVTNVSGNTFTFAISSNQTGMSGLQLWYNAGAPTFDGTGLTGTQYKPASAVNILTASASSSVNNSFTNSPGSPVLLDQAPGATGWGSQQSVSGTGGSIVNFNTSFANAGWFPQGIPSVFQFTFTGSQNLPFRTINPAQVMWDGTATAPLIGAINGSPTSTGTSVLLEVNGSLSAVPEPSSVCLMAMGLCGSVALVGRRRLRSV